MKQMNKTDVFRFDRTLAFMSRFIGKEERILDLGTPNQLSEFLEKNQFKVQSAFGFDFDMDPGRINQYDYDVLTAFEVIEHLVSPFPLLRETKARKLVMTVPLKLWFAKAFRNVKDSRDQHYHEFESWQLDMLLEKAGWEVKACEKWVPPFQPAGLRSVLRAVTPRFYAVYAERKSVSVG